MKVTALLTILFCLNAAAQDTLVLSPSMAVTMALERNFESRNSLLQVSAAAERAKWSLFDAEPAEILFRSGRLYSDENSQYLSITRNLGSLPEHILNNRLSRAELDKTMAEAEINRKKLTLDVKSEYYSWIYHNNLVKLLSDRQKILAQISDIVFSVSDSGYAEFENYSNIESVIAETGIELVNSIADMEIAANNLRMLIMSNDALIPSIADMPLYQVERISDTATYNGISIVNYYRELLNVRTVNARLMKSAFFPDIKVGVINQRIEPFGDLWGWQIGLKIPLVFSKEASMVKQTAMEEEIAVNNLENIMFQTEKEIENLLIQLDKYFRNIIYYDRYILPRIENDEKAAYDDLMNRDISINDYLNIITNSNKAKTEYIGMVNSYNQVAIKLEFYIN